MKDAAATLAFVVFIVSGFFFAGAAADIVAALAVKSVAAPSTDRP